MWQKSRRYKFKWDVSTTGAFTLLRLERIPGLSPEHINPTGTDLEENE
jgi:hypothetical protein